MDINKAIVELRNERDLIDQAISALELLNDKRRPESTWKTKSPATGRSSGGCPGYVIDHVQPLKRGGTDTASNMQWQTKEEAKAKDRIED